MLLRMKDINWSRFRCTTVPLTMGHIQDLPMRTHDPQIPKQQIGNDGHTLECFELDTKNIKKHIVLEIKFFELYRKDILLGGKLNMDTKKGGDLENPQCVRCVSYCTLEISPVFSLQGLLQFVQSLAFTGWVSRVEEEMNRYQ